ncbi:MAG TPA: efflux transporter outer membrane subunit [Candidatus Methylacidiphilales bacterium]
MFRFSHPTAVFALLSAVSVLMAAGCAVGPDYVKPTVPTSADFKENRFQDKDGHDWKQAQPQDMIAKGNWWEVFHDSQLDQFEREAETNNPDLKAAVDRVTEERATARVAQAEFFPNLDLDPTATRTRISPNGAVSIFSSALGGGGASAAPAGAGPTVPNFGKSAITFNDYRIPFDLSYEVDLWGRVRRNFEEARAQAEASQADYENVLLTLKADVALDYFNLRDLDEQRRIARQTVDYRRHSLDLYTRRLQVGMENELTISQAETELRDAEQQAQSLDQSRAKIEHALAILLGRNPADFNLRENATNRASPSIPVGLPSEVLERRPDVAEAERRMIAANAQIGVAKAAFFPVLRLTGDAGYESVRTSDLFDWPSRIFSLGPSVSFPVFEGGQNTAKLKSAHAAYDEALNNYREQVLQAFQQVEDSLSDIHYLALQIETETKAAQASARSADLAHRQFDAGSITFLTVVDTDRSALANQLTLSQLEGQKIAATVQLIKALGGGWQDSKLLTGAGH